MTGQDKSVACDLCKTGRIARRLEQVSFRQMSDKGLVHCSVTVMVGTCDNCHTRSTDPEAQAAFDEAFKCEYDKLP